ncbi:MAG: prenyltransferase/squalene oxidase repeat-containing protein [Nanoarchaeota archaeon]
MRLQIVREKALEFILDNRDSDKLWRDFETKTHGESVDWITSYVACNLMDSGFYDLEETADVIADRQDRNGGWGYNKKICPDADSTSWAISFLCGFGEKYYYSHLIEAEKFLKYHQNSDGGFGTYSEHEIRSYSRIPDELSVEGWCQSTPDVTVAAINALERLSWTSMRELNWALSYLMRNQKENGNWESYWWDSSVYPTASGIIVRDYQGVFIKKAQEWLVKENTLDEPPFYTALSLLGILNKKKYLQQTKKRVVKLLLTQQSDGSWDSGKILKFPSPDNIDPRINFDRWREDAVDQNRIFTTVTAYRALSAYEKKWKTI